MKRRYHFFGAVLILVGAAMLLDRAGILSITWHAVFWSLVSLGGAYKLMMGFAGDGKGLFWGTLFLLVGLYNALNELGLYEMPSSHLLSAFVLVIGLGFLAKFIKNYREWHLLVPALFFLSIGSAMGMAELDLLPRWEVIATVKNYWPVALILFGAALILNRRHA